MITADQAVQAVTDQPGAPSGFVSDGGDVWLVGMTGDIPINDTVVVVGKGDGLSTRVLYADEMETWPVAVSPDLTAAGPIQARAPKGTVIGGQWIETPNGLILSAAEAVGQEGTRPPVVAFDSPEFRTRVVAFDAFARERGLTEKSPSQDVLAAALEFTGYDKTLPTVVDDLSLVDGDPMSRTIAGAHDRLDQFLYGPQFPGTGKYGSGSYFHATPGLPYEPTAAVTNAPGWYPGKESGDGWRISAKRTGGVWREQDEFQNIGTNIDWKLSQIFGYNLYGGTPPLIGINDDGVASMLAGYDGVWIKGAGKRPDQVYAIVFNREAITVEAEA